MNALYLAWKYWIHYRFRSVVLTLCLALTFCAPLALSWITSHFEKTLIQRAESSPLVVGAPGSALDLTLHALYFQTRTKSTIPFGEMEKLESTQLGEAAPIFARYKARGFPLVGTTLDYFSLRNLRVEQGALFIALGDCVLGSDIAKELQLRPGDSILGATENVFDIAGAYPLKMTVRGILAPSNSPDDQAVFADLKTTWILEGIGHGHQDLENQPVPENLTFSQSSTQVVANAALNQYTEISETNLDSFHFHGDIQDYPLTAILFFPDDVKSRTLLIGRYNNPALAQSTQIAVCLDEVNKLLAMVFQAKKFFDLNHSLFLAVSILFLALTLSLSWKLRQKEFDTLSQIGSHRTFVFQLIAGELLLLAFTSILLSAVLGLALYWLAQFWWQSAAAFF